MVKWSRIGSTNHGYTDNMSNQQQVRDAIRAEYVKCAEDPAYFMKKYCTIQHPQRGSIKFDLYPFQERVLHIFRDNQYNIVLKSRQLGISTLSAGYSIWLMTFHKDKNVLAIATTQATAKNVITKIRVMYDGLPKWMKPKATENNKLSIRLANGSQAKAVSSNSDAARSEAVSLLLIDEAAFIDNVSETFTAAQQTLATGGQCIALSTPNGIGNWFRQTWAKAEQNDNNFVPIRLSWKVHPDRDEDWRKEQDKQLGPRNAAQECDCDFLSSGETVFEPTQLVEIEKTWIEDPVEKRGHDSGLWIWKHADYTRDYMLVADVARGDGADSSAFHVFDIATNEQVAEYRGKLPPRDYGNMLVGIATEYNSALLVVENANMGWSTIEQIQERGYANLYHSSKGAENETVESYMNKYENNKLTPGFTMSLRTRPLVVGKMLEYVREGSVTIKSSRLLKEMRVFVWKNGRAEAQQGFNDDLVMSLGIGMFVRDTAMKFRQQGQEMSRETLNAMANLNRNTRSQANDFRPAHNNPFKQQDSNGNFQDISWLLK